MTPLPQYNSSKNDHPFGMLMPGRSFSSTAYKYGFNGKEKDDEVKGAGNQQDYGFRIYDPRIAKFLSVDPITKQYPELTPYQFASNRPIDCIDIDGLEAFNSTTIVYGGIGAAAGIGYGFALAIQKCTAFDMIGKTKFIQTVAITPKNQDLYDSSDDPKLLLGADLGAEVGFEVVHRPTFEKAVNSSGASIPVDEVNFKLKAGIGVGVTLGSDKFGFSGGLGAGFAIKTGDQDQVLSSISLTYKESDRFGTGNLDFNLSPFESKLVDIDGKTMFQNEVGYMKNNKFIGSGINVYSEAKEVTQNGKTKYIDSNMYKSKDYMKSEKKINESE